MKNIRAFSLAELMIVLLIMTIILACTMPILSKRAKVKAAAVENINLPVKNEGDSCPPGNVAISADGTLLTCQGGTFKKPSSSGGAGQTLYLYSSYINDTSCPLNWSNGGVGVYSTYIYVRSCYNLKATCSTIYLYGSTPWSSDGNISPPACSTLLGGWTDGGIGPNHMNNGMADSYVRSCYKCD